MTEPVLHLAIPGDPTIRTGGYLYDARLALELQALGWTVRPIRLGDGFPFPDATALADAEARFAALPDGALVLTDGLAFGALPELAERQQERLRLVALVHHPLAYETGLDADAIATLLLSERRALAATRAVLVTSDTTARALAQDFAVPEDRIGTAPPGTDRRPAAAGSGEAVPRLLAVGSISARKGFLDLARALAPLRHLPWRLDLAGSFERSPSAVVELQAALADLGLEDRFHLLGEADGPSLDRLYRRSDLFVSSAAYEGFGMALAEAVASGLPIVAVAGGAVGDWLDPAAALLVPPGDVPALSSALARAIGDPALRARLRGGALAARERLPTWQETGARADALLRPLLG